MMNKYILRILPLLSLVLLLSNCRKKEWEAYYGRPENLEPPIYQQLEQKGNFKSLLATIDKAGYKNILSAAGYWTFFAPHDSAFQVYFKDQGISGVEQMDSTACQKIITYCLVYNAFKRERISDYQSPAGWVANNAFKRRTASYTGVYNGQDTSGRPIKVIASNRNNNGTTFFVDADNNNKHIPYFVDDFMQAKGLTATDYNYFYPNTTYTGFNVVDAVVTEQDIPAENGVIHVVNKVITTLPSLDEYLGSNPEYSEFKRLFDRFLVTYSLNAGVTQRYQARTGSSDPVYTKIFSQSLAFSPNNENFMKLQDNDAQANTYTMFAPRNAALTSYINSVLLEHYRRLEDLPINIINDFVNAHLWQTAVWPTKFNTTFNFLGEEARFNPSTDVVEKKILSNGIFYGTNKVQEANVFSSVFGKAYLDPQYSMMASLLGQELKFQISNIRQKNTLFLVSNSALNAAGYFADPTVSNIPNEQWRYTPPAGGTTLTGSSALVRLLRVLNLTVVPGMDITNVSGSGVAQSYGGEYIRFDRDSVFASGNVDTANKRARVLRSTTAKNGTVYYLDRILEFSNFNLGWYLKTLGTPTTSEYNFFWQYLRSSSAIYNASTDELVGIPAGTPYTFLVPNNQAIRDAVNAGLLPGTGTAPNKVPVFNPTNDADRELVRKFIQYHIINKEAVATDGQKSGSFETLFKNSNAEAVKVFVNNQAQNVMTVTDANNRTASVIMGNTFQTGSNNLGNRMVIHLINNYLKYTE